VEACTFLRDESVDVTKPGTVASEMSIGKAVSTGVSLTLASVTTRAGSRESPFLTKLLEIREK